MATTAIVATANELTVTVWYHAHAIFFERGSACINYPLILRLLTENGQVQHRHHAAKLVDAETCLMGLLAELRFHANAKGLSEIGRAHV